MLSRSEERKQKELLKKQILIADLNIAIAVITLVKLLFFQ